MKKIDIRKMARSAEEWVSVRTPGILVGFGLVGMAAAVVLAVIETPKAQKNIEEKKIEVQDTGLTKKEIFLATWKCYAPAVAAFAVAGTCIVISNTVSERRNAALAAAYKLSEAAYDEYQRKTMEMVGPKKEAEIRDEIAKDKAERALRELRDPFDIPTDCYPCVESMTSRVFLSNRKAIDAAFKKLNDDLNDASLYVEVGDLFEYLGLSSSMYDHMWRWEPDIETAYDKHYIDSQVGLNDTYYEFVHPVITYSSVPEDCVLPAGTPCMVIGYSKDPKANQFIYH